MIKSMIPAAIAILALAIVAAQTNSATVALIEPQMHAQTISPFEMMKSARGLPIDISSNAI